MSSVFLCGRYLDDVIASIPFATQTDFQAKVLVLRLILVAYRVKKQAQRKL